MSGRLACAVLFLVLGNPLMAAEPKRVETVTKSDIVYGTAGGEKLYLDLATPRAEKGAEKAAKEAMPCVVALHGGAWSGGSRKNLSRPVPWAELGLPEETGTARSFIEEVASRG